MKEILTLTVFLVSGILTSSAQQAENWTKNETKHGYRYNLYEVFDQSCAVILDFFETGSSPCMNNAAKLQKIYEEYPDVMVLAMDWNDYDSESTINSYMEIAGLTYPAFENCYYDWLYYTYYHFTHSVPHTIMLNPQTKEVVTFYEGEKENDYVIKSLLEQLGCNSVGVENYSSISNISIFPNPANDFFEIESDDLTGVKIYNVSGKLIDHFSSEDERLKINSSQYENGLYFIHLTDQLLKVQVLH